MNEKFNKIAKVEKCSTMLGIAVRLIVISPLVIFRSKNNYVSKGIPYPISYVDLVYKLRRVKDTPNFISSGSKIVKRIRRRQYDPLIIERTIGLVLGPSTTLYRPFLKHCTLTNKAVGTI